MKYVPAYIARLVVYAAAVAMCAGLFHALHIGCVFKFITGLDCPFCGMTRAYVAVLSGDFAGAFEANPLFLLFGLTMLLLPVRKEDVSNFAWGAVNILFSLIGMAYFARWVVRVL